MDNRQHRYAGPHPHPQAKRRRRLKKGARRALIVICALVILLGVAAGALLVAWQWLAPPPPGRPAPQRPSYSRPQPIDRLSRIPQPVHADNSGWNYITPVLNDVQAPDYRMLALPSNGRVDMGYFDDVTFVGDSITQALELYKSIPNASYCAYKGISPRQIYDGSMQRRLDGTSEVPMEMLLASAPGKVYVLMGTNTMVSYDDDSLLAYYEEMLNQILAQLPQAKIYIQSITPVVPGKHASLNRERIDGLNHRLAKLAVDKGYYFVNLQEALADEEGNLRSEFAGGDGYHMTPRGCEAWRDYLVTHTAYDLANPYLPDSGDYRQLPPEE